MVRKLQGHHRGVYGVAFSPDGKRLASGGIAAIVEGKRVDAEITLWDLQRVYDVAKQAEVRRFPSQFRMRPVAFSPDDELLAAGNDDGTVKLWSVAKLRK
jgi:WD40 repeat protein